MPIERLAAGLLARLELALLMLQLHDLGVTEYFEWQRSQEWAACARVRLNLPPLTLEPLTPDP